jgi:hypothetical protein
MDTDITDGSLMQSANKTISNKCLASINITQNESTKIKTFGTRTQTILYRTSHVARKMCAIANSLKNGSIHQALRVIKETEPQAFQKFVTLLIKREGEKFAHYENSNILRNNTPEDLRETNLKEMINRTTEHCPLGQWHANLHHPGIVYTHFKMLEC